MKVEKIILFVALGLLFTGVVIAALALRGGGSMGWSLDLADMSYSDSRNQVQNTMDLEKFDKLDIQISSADLVVTTGDSYQFSYKVPEGREPIVEQSNGTLLIKQPQKRSFVVFDFTPDNNIYRLTVPAGDKEYDLDLRLSSGDVSIESVPVSGKIRLSSGDLNLSGFDAESLSIEESSGSTALNGVNLSSLKIKMSSGSLLLQDAEVSDIAYTLSSGDLKLSSVKAESISGELSSGDVIMDDVSAGQIKGKLTSGEMMMNLIGNRDDYDYDLSATSGDIILNGEEIRKSYQKDTGSDGKIDVHATSGDVIINFR